MIDDVLRGIVAATSPSPCCARQPSPGWSPPGAPSLAGSDHAETVRMLTLAEQLEAAGHLELRDSLS